MDPRGRGVRDREGTVFVALVRLERVVQGIKKDLLLMTRVLVDLILQQIFDRLACS